MRIDIYGPQTHSLRSPAVHAVLTCGLDLLAWALPNDWLKHADFLNGVSQLTQIILIKDGTADTGRTNVTVIQQDSRLEPAKGQPSSSYQMIRFT